MPFRKLLIYSMLWLLGLTAIAGAIAALIGDAEVIEQIVGTGLCATVGTGLMIAFSNLAEKSKIRRDGLLGMLVVVIEFATALGFIWEIFNNLGIDDLQYNVALSMGFLAVTALPAILFLGVTRNPSDKVAAVAGVSLFAAEFAVLMIATWHLETERRSEALYQIASTSAAIGILGIASLAGIGIKPARRWRWIGVAASIVAIVGASYALWNRIESGAVAFNVIVSIAAVVAHANLCLRVPLRSSQKWVRAITIFAGIVTAIIVDALTIAEAHQVNFPRGENIETACAIVTSCGSLALLVLARVNRHLDRVPFLSEIREVMLVCPGCKKKQMIPAGESSCSTCGLKFNIRFEEPRCSKCDYLLFMLQSDRCPECGTIVGELRNAPAPL